MCLLVTLNQWKQLNLPFYSAPAIGIFWVTSVGHIWCFHVRAPSGLRMEIYYWSQNYATHWQDAYDLLQLLPNVDCDLLCSPNYSYDKKRSEIRCLICLFLSALWTYSAQQKEQFSNYSLLRWHVRVLWTYNVPTSLLDQLPKKVQIIQQNKIFFIKVIKCCVAKMSTPSWK